MDVIDHEAQPLEQWREGVMTKMRMSFLLGGRQLCIFEQWCAPGLGAPIHVHAVEEVLEVLAGQIEITLEGETAAAGPNHSVLIPAGARHGFRNVGTDTLHVRATIASPIFEGEYDRSGEGSRRWSPHRAG